MLLYHQSTLWPSTYFGFRWAYKCCFHILRYQADFQREGKNRRKSKLCKCKCHPVVCLHTYVLIQHFWAFLLFLFRDSRFTIILHHIHNSHTHFTISKNDPQKVQSHCLFGSTIKHAWSDRLFGFVVLLCKWKKVL